MTKQTRDERVRDLMASEYVGFRTRGWYNRWIARGVRWWRHLIYGRYGEGSLDQGFDYANEVHRLMLKRS